jgi:signal-transduction protein with cAMP-binding, CBS, and nucleotidyltransferase domain
MNASITRVKDVMQKEVLSIDGMASATEVAAMMRASRVSELLVDKRHDDDAWGIITIRDLVNSIILPGRDAEKVFAYEIMTKPVITIPAQMDIRYAIRLIQRLCIHRAPVEQMGEVVGMVTLSSLILDYKLI